MATETNERPSQDERYALATNSSNLRLNPDAECDATHLIAAGLIGNRMGAALMHLRAEWDTAEKPRKATEAEILARAGELPRRKDKLDVKRARTEALLTYARDMRRRAHAMLGWVSALSIMVEWAQLRGLDVDLLSPALYHWLSPTCPVCDGLGSRRMDDAPVLGKTCYHCNGAGIWPRPPGAERVQDWLQSCIGKARADRGGIIRGRIDSEDLRERAARRQAPAEEDERGAAAVAEVARRSMGRR